MRRVDRLLLKIQEAQRLDEMQLAVPSSANGLKAESGKYTPTFGTGNSAAKPSGLQWNLILWKKRKKQ